MNESGKNNITLIGMPASGKSTVGVILAKILGLSFVDTDLVIQQREGALLCDIISERGLEGFLKAEESAVLSISPSNTVIATGGSVVYSEAGMEYLKSLGKVVYLKVEKEDLFKRLHNIKQRGVVLSPGETLDEMYATRSVLYEKYADIVIDETNASVEETVEMIRELMK
ncbi:MAG: shikimate kinase [Eubacterium sp.]|nr:shikimate kinase [Eubacterium sp.]